MPVYNAMLAGGAIGTAASVALFAFVPAYHNFVMWQWHAMAQHPVLILPAVAIGCVAGWLSD